MKYFQYSEMTKNGKIKVYTAMFFAVLFWGFSFVWSKQVLAVYKPVTLIFFRLNLSVFFLFLFGILFHKIQKIKKEDRIKIIIIAFFEPFIYFLGENFGLTRVSSTVASVIISTIPLFSLIAAYFFSKEKMTFTNIIGILFSIAGVFLVILKDGLSFKADFWGVGFMLLAVFGAVVYSLLVLDITRKYNVYSIIAYQNLIGVFLFAPLFFIFEYKDFILIPFSWKAWFPLLELAVFASTIAFMLFTFGIKHLGVTRANTISNLIPVVTALFSFIILGENFSLLNIIGILVVVTGLILSQLKRNKKSVIINEY